MDDVASLHGCAEKSRSVSPDAQSAAVAVFVPASSDYFDGHFPALKLLPAVAQADLVSFFAKRCFGNHVAVRAIKRFKFSAKIFPDTTIVIKLRMDKKSSKIAFEILDETETASFSSGTFSF